MESDITEAGREKCYDRIGDDPSAIWEGQRECLGVVNVEDIVPRRGGRVRFDLKRSVVDCEPQRPEWKPKLP